MSRTELEERLIASAATKFFSDAGLPEQLQRDLLIGWEAYQERRREREKVGAPLPPGGCFILGHPAVIAQCMAEAHAAVADACDLPHAAVKLRLEDRKIVAAVELPPNWPEEKTSRAYLEGILRTVNEVFWHHVGERLAAVDMVRPL